MKHKTNPEKQAPVEDTIDGPGSQLRKARERKGLEQSKMAAQLHLSEAMIQALEWDDYEKLPAAVFVQGYLKNYARLLGVDEAAVIRAYQELQPDADQQPLPSNQPDDVARELRGDHRLIRYIAFGVLLVVGVLIFFWWQGRMNPDESPATVEESSGMIEPSLSAPEEALTLAPEQTLPAFRDLSDASSQAVVEDRIDASADDLSSTDSSSVSPLSEPEPPFEAEPMTDTPATAVVSEEVSLSETSESAAAMAEPAPAPVAAGRVVFEFSGPCWVEVRDVNNRTRIIGVMREGTRRSLDAGLGPFRVVIGDIKVARLTVNGEAYDLQQHTRGKVARFTLDPSAL